MDLGLQGARVLVTAASRGLGAAVARRFSLEGAHLVINSRRLDTLQDTAAAINRESDNPIYTIAADIKEPAAATRLVQQAVEMLGGLDILVANSGGPPSGTFDDFHGIAAWQDAVDLLLFSTVSLIQAALPYLRGSTRPSVLAITSSAVKQPVINLTLSNAVRPAVVGLTKTLALELGSEGIRVNSIMPGMTDTERIGELMQGRAEKFGTTAEEERHKATASIPLGRMGKPEEFANAAVFLCSPAAGFITGIALAVDGGTIQATL